MNWVKPPIETDTVRSLAAAHNLDLLTASILTRRELTSPSRIAFFLEEDERFLHNPFLFPDMEKAVDRILAAVEEEERVLVCGDKDADGITATVLMVEALRNLGLEPAWHVPVDEEDYGLNPEVLRQHAALDVTLVLAVDCGITDFSEIRLAGELGMDVIVFDHHEPRKDELPDAHAIINPKIPGSYPFDGLCAAAIVSKFHWALSLARTDLWGQEFCLIHGRIDGDAVNLDAVLMRNLAEIGRRSISSTDTDAERLRFLQFIEHHPLFTYRTAVQKPLISAFFGGADVSLADIGPELSAVFPSLGEMNIDELESGSRMARYFPRDGGAISTLRNLMLTLQYRALSEAFTGWRRGLDLVALGTLADLMPLDDENRILVRLGMSRLNGTDSLRERRAALRELLIRQRLHEGRVGTTEVAWQICPLVNATGRMGRADLGVGFFLENDQTRLPQLADQIVELNRQRRSLGEELWNRVRPEALRSKDALGGRMVIVADPTVPRGITGILATRLNKTLEAAAVVISVRDDAASGSIRSDHSLSALEWLEAMGGLLSDYGGHLRAGGFRLPAAAIGELVERTRVWLAGADHLPVREESLTVDAELSHNEIVRLGPEGLDRLIDRLEPYGEGFGPLTFLTRSVRILQAELVGKPRNNHLKLLVSLGSRKWPALWWDGAEQYGSVIRRDTDVDLVYRVDRDRWRGADARRLTILEATPCNDSR